MTSQIGWLWKEGYTGESWNFVTGCHKVSDGCRNCYAERLSLDHRWSKLPWAAQNAHKNVTVHWDRMDKPLHWKKPRMVFVNSMSDLFHELVPHEAIARAVSIMDNPNCRQHIFIILTKRPERAAAAFGEMWWPHNVWIGTSVEDLRVVGRIDALRPCKTFTKFISFEPLIGPVGKLDLTGYQWAIVGGESGPNFRPMDMAWARAIRDQCVRQGVAFFYKQGPSYQSGASPYLIEADGSKTTWRQYPGDAVANPNYQPPGVTYKSPQPQQLSLF